MKKIIFIALVVSINSLYGMEVLIQEEGQTFKCSAFPNIVIVQDNINQRCRKNANITIVGMNERRMQFKKLEDLWSGTFIGSLEIKHGRVETRQYRDKIIIGDQLLFITEPCIVLEPVESNELLVTDYEYNEYIYTKAIEDRACCSTLSRTHRFTGIEAIKEALDDLSYCYNIVLQNAYKYFIKEHTERSIAFPQLGISSGIPVYAAAQLAVASIVGNSNKDKYRLIELVVPDEDSFNLYKAILLEHQEKAALKNLSQKKKEE